LQLWYLLKAVLVSRRSVDSIRVVGEELCGHHGVDDSRVIYEATLFDNLIHQRVLLLRELLEGVVGSGLRHRALLMLLSIERVLDCFLVQEEGLAAPLVLDQLLDEAEAEELLFVEGSVGHPRQKGDGVTDLPKVRGELLWACYVREYHSDDVRFSLRQLRVVTGRLLWSWWQLLDLKKLPHGHKERVPVVLVGRFGHTKEVVDNLMMLWPFDQVLHKAVFLLYEKEEEDAEANIFQMRPVRIEGSAEMAPEHEHVVLVFEWIEDSWVLRVHLGPNEEHVGGQEGEAVLILSAEVVEELVEEVGLIHQPGSMQAGGELANEVHYCDLGKHIHHLEEILENLGYDWFGNLLGQAV